MIDLHSHTTASDGQHAPETLVALAAQAGVQTLAVTDHDTVGGIERALAEAGRRGLTLVPGLELSAFIGGREIHVLGHFVRPEEPRLGDFSRRLRSERRTRMAQMVDKLNAMGIPVTLAEVEAIARSGAKLESAEINLGRPHLARALVERGLCLDVKEAFERFLGQKRPAFVERCRLDFAQAIDLIRAAGGAATLAHPGVSKVEQHEIAKLRQAGLSGLEVLHSDHNPSVRAKYLAIARTLDLVPTAGSDFHGEQVAPQRRLGETTMSAEDLARLRARAG